MNWKDKEKEIFNIPSGDVVTPHSSRKNDYNSTV